METLKKVINIAAMVFLVIAFLFLLRILSVDKFVALFDLADDGAFYRRLLWVGAVLLLAELLVENAYIASLKRGLEREHRQITELKAQLYDQRLKTEAALSPERQEMRPVLTPEKPVDPTVPPAPYHPENRPDLPPPINHHRPLP
ncbi:MAG: hypothetical protein ACO1OQ_00355 [Rufibacter sp.]